MRDHLNFSIFSTPGRRSIDLANILIPPFYIYKQETHRDQPTTWNHGNITRGLAAIGEELTKKP